MQNRDINKPGTSMTYLENTHGGLSAQSQNMEQATNTQAISAQSMQAPSMNAQSASAQSMNAQSMQPQQTNAASLKAQSTGGQMPGVQQVQQQVDSLRVALHDLMLNKQYADGEIVSRSADLDQQLQNFSRMLNDKKQPSMRTF